MHASCVLLLAEVIAVVQLQRAQHHSSSHSAPALHARSSGTDSSADGYSVQLWDWEFDSRSYSCSLALGTAVHAPIPHGTWLQLLDQRPERLA